MGTINGKPISSTDTNKQRYYDEDTKEEKESEESEEEIEENISIMDSMEIIKLPPLNFEDNYINRDINLGSLRIVLNDNLKYINIENNFSEMHGMDRYSEKCQSRFKRIYEILEEGRVFGINSDYDKDLNNLNYFSKISEGLTGSFLFAYDTHKTLKLKPDDIQYVIMETFSIFIDKHSEQFRYFFVEHEGKKELKIDILKLDIEHIVELIVNEINKNIKDKEFMDIITTKYTTTTPINNVVNNILIMNTFKKYFEYMCELSCGIPSIILDGTYYDWIKLYKLYNEIKKFTKKIGETELDNWFSVMDYIMYMFVDIARLANEHLINNPQSTKYDDIPIYYKTMWAKVICTVPFGSGGQKGISGWASMFCPYDDENNVIKINKILTPDNYYDFNYFNRQINNFNVIKWCRKSITKVPLKLILYGAEYSCELVSGIYHPTVNNDIVIITYYYGLYEIPPNSKSNNDYIDDI